MRGPSAALPLASTDKVAPHSLPDVKTKRYIFKIHTSRMSLGPDVDLEEFVHTKDDLSGADIKAVCTEAGLLALRERRMQVNMVDFKAAREKVLFQKKDEGPAGLCEYPSLRARGPGTDFLPAPRRPVIIALRSRAFMCDPSFFPIASSQKAASTACPFDRLSA